MKGDLALSVCMGLILGMFHGAAQAVPVVPNFTTGTVTSHSESTTTVTETIRQIDYQTGWTYSATGTNITFPGAPALGTAYTQTTPGAPFQFSESYFGPGQSRLTEIDRMTTITSTTDTLSVFTQ